MPKNAGFTLIELLVVVLIIGILSAVALPQYQKAVMKSRTAEAWTTLRSIETALQLKRLEDGKEQIRSSDYFAGDGYTFEDLDLSLPGASGQYYHTKYWTYNLGWGYGVGIFAQPSYGMWPSDVSCVYLFLRDGKRYCQDDCSNGNGCKKLGLSEKESGKYCLSANLTCWTN